MIEAFVGLGSNIENPGKQLQTACQKLAALPKTQLVALSAVYESPPMGPPDQPWYLNACARLQTLREPEDLLDALLAIEAHMGRVRHRRWGERCIDLDLLLFGNRRIQSDRLTVPHPGLYTRDFVLRPLSDLVGSEYVMPNGVDIGTLLAGCTTGSLMKRDIQLPTGESLGISP